MSDDAVPQLPRCRCASLAVDVIVHEDRHVTVFFPCYKKGASLSFSSSREISSLNDDKNLTELHRVSPGNLIAELVLAWPLLRLGRDKTALDATLEGRGCGHLNRDLRDTLIAISTTIVMLILYIICRSMLSPLLVIYEFPSSSL